MRNLLALRLHVESHRKVETCKSGSCQEATKEGKTFCKEHVQLQPYVQNLIKRISDRKKEDEWVRVNGSKAVNLGGITVKEILLHLKEDARTEERLEIEIQLDKVTIHNYLVRLSMEGIVKFGRTKRNNICVRLAEAK